MDRTDPTTRRSFESAARTKLLFLWRVDIGWNIFCRPMFLVCWWLRNAIGRQKMFQPIAYDQWLCRRRESRGLKRSRQDISALDHQCLPPGSGHGSPKRGLTRLYGRIFWERFVTKNSYHPSIKIIVSCGAFKAASSGMVRSIHGTHPLV